MLVRNIRAGGTSGTHPDGIQVVLVDNRDLSRVARPRLDGVLVKLPIISHHVQLLLHGNVPESLLHLVVAGEEDDALLGGKEGELVLAGLVECSEIEAGDADTDIGGDLFDGISCQW